MSEVDINQTTSYLRVNKYSVDFLNQLDELTEDKEVRQSELLKIQNFQKLWESIQYLSPSFYQFLKGQKIIDSKLKKTLLKYGIHGASRATPLGNLVSVSNQYSDDNLSFDLDSKWMELLLKQKISLNKLPDWEHVTFFKNGNAVIDGDVAYIYVAGEEEAKRTVSVDDNLQKFLNLISGNEHIGMIAKKLKIDESNLESLKKSLQVLVDQDVLCWQFDFPRSSNVLYLKNVLSELTIDSDIVNKVEEVCTSIEKFNLIKPTESEIEDLTNHMTKLVEYKHLLQVNLSEKCRMNADSKSYINNQMKVFIKDVSRLVPFLSESSLKRATSAYLIENYGSNVLVPLDEIISGSLFDQFQRDSLPTHPDEKVYEILKDTLDVDVLNLRINKKPIDLKSSRFFRRAFQALEQQHIPRTNRQEMESELIFQSMLNEEGQLSPVIELSHLLGPRNIGKMIGRFVEKMGNQERTAYDEFLNENLKKEDFITATPLQVPSKADLFNVLNCREAEPATLSFDSTSSQSRINLRPSELFLAATDDGQTIIYSKDHKRPVRVVGHHMLNTELSSPVVRFLEYLSQPVSVTDVLLSLQRVIKELQVDSIIKYGNIVVSKPVKLISKNIIPFLKSNENLSAVFDGFMLNNRVQVSVPESDEYVILNISVPLQREVLMRLLEKNQKVEVRKPFELMNSQTSEQKLFNCELVISSVLRLENSQPEKLLLPLQYQSEWKNPLMDSGIVYFKILLNYKAEVSFIVDYIYPFLERLRVRGQISGYHFVRYLEQSSQIRLRIFGLSERKNSFGTIKEITEKIESSKIVHGVSLEQFQRETQRYGGYDLTNDYLVYSTVETRLVCEILRMTQNSVGLRERYAVSCIQIFMSMMPDQVSIRGAKRKQDILVQKEFREKRNEYNEFYKKVVSDTSNIKLLLDEWLEYLKKYSSGLKGSEYDLTLVLQSVIHMFCNRLFGINRDIESKVLLTGDLLFEMRKHLR